MKLLIKILILAILVNPLSMAEAQTGETVPFLTREQKREMRKKEREYKRNNKQKIKEAKKNKGRRKTGKRLQKRISKTIKKEKKIDKRIVKAKQGIFAGQPDSYSPKIERLKGKKARLRDKRSKLGLKYSHKIQESSVEKRMKKNQYKEKPKKRKKYDTD